MDIVDGMTIGKYDILRKLATGGMAEIYLARGRGKAGFEKLVVLKRILPSVAEDPDFIEMFLDEARLAATLQHPHIADVYDVDHVDGMYFFTMAYVHGQDSRAICRAARKHGERIPLAIAVGIIHSVASALDYAHERCGPDGPLGLVHRDISASNILVSYDGAVKLVDFGIARSTSREHTRTGTLKGKIPYMSPEQCQSQQIDRRSDLFSLGTVFFELTVGRRPYRGDSDYALMEQIVRGDAPKPSTFDPAYPPELEAIVLRLLARDLNARYQSAAELLRDLEPFQASHQLWVSANVISRYMRSMFGEDIDAWEHAARAGVTLDQHVTTVGFQRREVVTPAAPIPAPAEPVRSSSYPLPFAPAPSSSSFSLVSSIAMPPTPTPRSNRRLIVIAGSCVAALGLGIGLTTTSVLLARSSEESASTTAPAPPPERSPPPAATPRLSVTPISPSPPTATVDTPAPPIASSPIAKPLIAKPSDAKRSDAKPVAPPPVVRPARPSPPAAPTADKPKPKLKPIKPKPEEATWDVNSPSLPRH
jgi:serine/threonine protein kinase